MDPADDRFVDDQIRKSVSDTVPPAVERCLRAQLAVFRSKLRTPDPVVARHPHHWGRPAAWWGLGATCAAVVVLVLVPGLLLRPQTSFAEVTTAVLQQPWIHVRSVYSGDGESEEWFSPTKDISASRSRDSVKYEDYRLQVYYSYNSAEQVLYRGPVVWKSQAGQFESMAEALKVLLQGDHPPDKPLAHLGFLGSERDKMKVLDQRVEKVTEKDHTWLDYRLTVKYSESADPVRMLFRVDASTKLPRLCRTEGHWDGKPVTRENQFDYPERGPADIYDLGVPKTAKLVDRVPAGDLKRILETLKAGRDRMDQYRAMFVMQLEGIDYAWWAERPEIFYRKGDRYRRDFVGGGPRDRGTLKPPAADVDLRNWWLDRAKLHRFYPIYVQVGPTSYTCMLKTAIDPDGSQHQEIGSVDKYVYNLKPGETVPVDYSMRPEWGCRPPMGIGDEHQEPMLDLHPAEGPSGCILLSVGHTTKEGRVNEKGIGLADGIRYWLDPQRDYIVMRWDSVVRDEKGQEKIIESDRVEETARSPQGVWFATKIRRKNPSPDGKSKPIDQVYHIYVDFDAELPDSLFEPPTPRRIQ
jgi:hypothetical protein